MSSIETSYDQNIHTKKPGVRLDSGIPGLKFFYFFFLILADLKSDFSFSRSFYEDTWSKGSEGCSKGGDRFRRGSPGR